MDAGFDFLGMTVRKYRGKMLIKPSKKGVLDFQVGLSEAGYTPLTAVMKLRSVGYLSRWLEERGLEYSGLTEERVQEYLRGRRAEGHDWEISRQALRPILDLMAGRGMLPPPSTEPPADGVESLFARFLRYLLEERGLVASTAAAYVRKCPPVSPESCSGW